MHVTYQHQLWLTVDNSICWLLLSVCTEAFRPALGEAQLFNTLQRDIPRCYFWFLYILCSKLLYKELPPLFLLFIYLFPLASHLPASGSFPQWEDNPGSSRGSFDLPLIFPNSFAHKRIGLRGSVGTSVYSFPWIGSELTKLDIFSLAKAEERSAEGFHGTKVVTKSTSSAIKIGWRFWCNSISVRWP